MSSSSIRITVKLFSIYQEVYGKSEVVLILPLNTPVKAVLDDIIDNYPSLEQWRAVTRFGVNCNFVDGETKLQNGDEVVLIPPVSGG